MLTNTIDTLQLARRGGYCVAAFNTVDYLTTEAVVLAAEEKRSPVIVQVSAGTIKRFGTRTLVEWMRILDQKTSVPISLHLDHGRDVGVIRQAILDGFSSVMYDGSNLPFEENVAQTRDIVEFAHAHGVSVEGEIGVVAGVEDDIVIREDAAIYTTPEEAERFRRESGADFVAAAIGTAHGFYKVKPRLNIETLRTIAKSADYPLVVHGGTGLDEETIRELVRAGAAKFNVSTQIKQTYIDALATYIESHRREYHPLKMLEFAKESLVAMLGGYMDILSSSGRA
ncbi:MAG: class II fructose-bisphosphate aldolase [Planctomycetia bacterium]|nr:class II fructose-bisphosphate aldolase [Planctomycetia bacterium]